MLMERQHPSGEAIYRLLRFNLPLIALESVSIEDFFKKLDYYINLANKQLYDRYLYQSRKTPDNFKFLYGQGVGRDSETLNKDSNLKNSSSWNIVDWFCWSS